MYKIALAHPAVDSGILPSALWANDYGVIQNRSRRFCRKLSTSMYKIALAHPAVDSGILPSALRANAYDVIQNRSRRFCRKLSTSMYKIALGHPVLRDICASLHGRPLLRSVLTPPFRDITRGYLVDEVTVFGVDI